jgi:hypothetical protein
MSRSASSTTRKASESKCSTSHAASSFKAPIDILTDDDDYSLLSGIEDETNSSDADEEARDRRDALFQKSRPKRHRCAQDRYDITTGCEYVLTEHGQDKLFETEIGKILFNEAEVEKNTYQGILKRLHKSPNLIKHLIENADPDMLFPIVAEEDQLILSLSVTVKKAGRREPELIDSTTLYESGFCKAIFAHFDQVY